MSQNAAIARALAALGHEARLAIYRLLVRAGEEGLNVGEIAAHLKMPASTLAHHLSTLVAAGLVIQERRGREVVRSEEHTSELQSLMRTSYAVFCLKQKNMKTTTT